MRHIHSWAWSPAGLLCVQWPLDETRILSERPKVDNISFDHRQLITSLFSNAKPKLSISLSFTSVLYRPYFLSISFAFTVHWGVVYHDNKIPTGPSSHNWSCMGESFSWVASTHLSRIQWDRDKMAAVLHKDILIFFFNADYCFSFWFQWNLFRMVQLTMLLVQHIAWQRIDQKSLSEPIMA